MSTSDSILLAQTIIALATGGVVAWYTWLTQNLARHAQAQIRIQKDQLDLMKKDLADKEDSQRRASYPWLRWQGGSSGQSYMNRDFENVGADIYDVAWEAPDGIEITALPRGVIKRGECGNLGIVAPENGYPLRVSLRFTSHLGECWNMEFEIAKNGSEPRKISVAKILAIAS